MNLNYQPGNVDFRAVIPFSKVERMADGRLMIEGIATSEAIDHDNEIIDYESAKLAFGAWSGNIREQHDPKKAVGRALCVIADDIDKKITVRAFISNGAKDTQEKCLDGTLSCYSIGGSVAKREPQKVKKADGSEVDVNRLYIRALSETSVVDKGSNPDTSFTLVKSVGDHLEGVGLEQEPVVDEAAAAKAAEDAAKAIADAAKTTTEPELVVTGEDQDVAAFAKALNDSGLSMKDAIEALPLLVTKREDAKKTPEPPKPIEQAAIVDAFKALDDAGKATLFADLRKEMPADELRDAIEQAFAVSTLKAQLPTMPLLDLAKMAEAQLTVEERTPLETFDDVRKAILAKAMTAAHRDKVQAVHDHMFDMGADCGGSKAVKNDDVAKLQGQVETLTKQVADFGKQPRPHVLTLRAVQKAQNEETKDWVLSVPYPECKKSADNIIIDWEATRNDPELKAKYGAA